jgi:hypothetical protein
MKTIHDKINEKVGIEKFDIDELLPLDFCLENFRSLVQRTHQGDSTSFRKTMRFLFGTDCNSAIMQGCYQYNCRRVKDMTLDQVFRNQSRKLYNKMVEYPNYFNVKN